MLGGTGMNGEFAKLYQKFENVTVVNLDISTKNTQEFCPFRFVRGDGRALPFPDKSFDWVFSNAVIEHVGGEEDQKKFATEIRRVAARGYFITSPNRYFPIEPHALLPFYQFYPACMKPLALRFSLGYMKEVEQINLLTRKKMQSLFFEARVQHVNFASALIAFHVRS